MALPLFRVGFILLLFTASIASALRVTPNSPCTTVCVSGGSTTDQSLSGTHEGDIVCNDDDYTSKKGLQFEECLNCLQASSFGTDANNDQMWFIYNLRYASDCEYRECIYNFRLLILGQGVFLESTTPRHWAALAWSTQRVTRFPNHSVQGMKVWRQEVSSITAQRTIQALKS